MGLISLVIVLLVVGVALWAVETLIPLDAVVKRLVEVIVVLAVLIYLLRGLAVL